MFYFKQSPFLSEPPYTERVGSLLLKLQLVAAEKFLLVLIEDFLLQSTALLGRTVEGISLFNIIG